MNIKEQIFSKNNILLLSNKLAQILQINISTVNAQKYCIKFIVSQMKYLYAKYKDDIIGKNFTKIMPKLNQKCIERCIHLYKEQNNIPVNNPINNPINISNKPIDTREPPISKILEKLVLEREQEYGNGSKHHDDIKSEQIEFNDMNGLKGLSDDYIKTPCSPINEYDLNLKLEQMQNERKYFIPNNNNIKYYITGIEPNILLQMKSNELNDYIIQTFGIKQQIDNKQEVIKMLMEIKEKHNENKQLLENNYKEILNNKTINITINVCDIVKNIDDYNDYLYELSEKITNITGIIINQCEFPLINKPYNMFFYNISNNLPCLEILSDGTYKQINFIDKSISSLEELIIQFKYNNNDNELVNFEGKYHLINLSFITKI